MENMFEGFLNVVNTNEIMSMVMAFCLGMLLVQVAIKGYYFINNIIDDRAQVRADNEYWDDRERRE